MTLTPPNPVTNLYIEPSEAGRGPHDISPTETSYYCQFGAVGGRGAAYMTVVPPIPSTNLELKPSGRDAAHMTVAPPRPITKIYF